MFKRNGPKQHADGRCHRKETCHSDRRKALDTSTHSRIPSLDGLRALSIALVLVAHFSYSNGSPIRHSALMDVYAHYGVRIFLVLSGYLITTLLRREQEQTGTINLRRFYVRRVYRLMPAAYLYLIVVTVVFRQSLPHKYLVAAYLYLTSYALHSPWVLMHLWSLSVEEQFYLLWPAALAVGLIGARCFGFGAVAIAPVVRFALSGVWFLGTLWSFPAVADSLAAGCLLALYQSEFDKRRSFFTWRGFPLIWALTLSIPILHQYHYLIKLWHISGLVSISAITMFNLGIVLCIQNAITVRPRLLNTPMLVWIGNLSYSLYLWNMPFTNPDVRSWATTFPQNLILTLLVATASFYAVEQPIRNMRERRSNQAKKRVPAVLRPTPEQEEQPERSAA
jgi:peptidoglycan/LPS O-acetylase OafA/YrhL